METLATGGTFKEISKSKVAELQIPLPPLEIQKEIVAEIEGLPEGHRRSPGQSSTTTGLTSP
jgi:restriction endonuclease S subunit